MRKNILAAIRAHAVAEYPREACGLIVSDSARRGPGGAAERYVPCRNVAVDGGQFMIAADEYAAAEDAGQVLAVVHSHPDADPTPSEADRVACEASGLPWYIAEVRQADDGVVTAGQVYSWAPEGYQAPLLGREFHHGILDCYSIIRDWYERERGIELPDFDRADGWWEGEAELYLEHFGQAGFRRLDGDEALVPGDVILMQVLSQRTNHAGVYLGAQPLAERPDLHPLPDAMLHHLYNRPAERVVYGGYWRDVTRARLRYIGPA
ncbi:NlpC/P60 family [Bordetella ansorpii]|uniref:NlpC/P60 family n=1 Tax=Bordetella ansorpii TaxID=288768 RepID=A0A157SKP5_9BORD|nr:C40 family peptidase [Bordetella ansorpii]SAI70466.1 NlpC/P60 family [Bordetella ansorpii]